MSCKIALFVRVSAVVCWLVSAVSVSPWWFKLSANQNLFVVAAACVWSYAWIARAHSQPAVELYLAGKDIGRREALLEQQCENVARLSEQPSLRVINGAR